MFDTPHSYSISMSRQEDVSLDARIDCINNVLLHSYSEPLTDIIQRGKIAALLVVCRAQLLNGALETS
jgi:hypothetical protein